MLKNLIVPQIDPVKVTWLNMLTRQQNKIDKSNGYSSILLVRPVGALEHAESFANRHLSNFQSIARTCIVKTSQVTYTTGWGAFNDYCELASINPSLKVVPTSMGNRSLPLPLPVMVIGSFMAWLSVDKGLNPNTVSQYTSAVRDGFRQQLGVDYSFFDHVVLKQVRQSLRLAWAAKETQTANLSKRLPITIEMLITMRKNIVNFADLHDRASYIACIMATTMILRRSHLVMTTADHFIRAKDVKFFFYDPKNKLSSECSATDAALHSVKHLVEVSVYIRSSKVDILGEGYTISYKVQNICPTCAFCVAKLMFEWAQVAQPLPSNPFLSFNGNVGKPWALKYEEYKGVIKRTAMFCGFNKKWFDTHSCRIGGATIMAADGHPNHSIQRAGGWSSLSFLDYVQWTQKSWDSVLGSLSNPKLFTNDHMKKLNPNAVFVSV